MWNYICNKTVFAFVRIAVGIGTLLVALFVPFSEIMDVCNFFMFNFLVDCDGASDTYCWFCRVGPGPDQFANAQFQCEHFTCHSVQNIIVTSED